MPQFTNNIIQSELYNNLPIDHLATKRAAEIGLKKFHIPQLCAILERHHLNELFEPHLLHRHFKLHEGEVLIHCELHAVGDSNNAPATMDIAKPMNLADVVEHELVPLLWMVSDNTDLVAYEFGMKRTPNAIDGPLIDISAALSIPFISEFTSYVQVNNLSDVVSLKNRSCLSGGEYVSTTERALFRIPNVNITLQPGSSNVESGWVAFNCDPEPTDGHVTQTRQTAGGTVAHRHVVKQTGPDAINPAEVPQCYVDALWAAHNSKTFWTSGACQTRSK